MIEPGDNYGWDTGQRVPVTDFPWEQFDAHPADEDRARRETVCRLLQFLATDGTVRQVGRRALLLAFLVKAIDCQTHAELAKRLGVTRSRVTQALASLRRGFTLLNAGAGELGGDERATEN